MTNFAEKLRRYSNDELERIAAKYLALERIGAGRSKRLDAVYDECARRNPEIFDKAREKAWNSLLSISERKIEDDLPIGRLAEEEIEKLAVGVGTKGEIDPKEVEEILNAGESETFFAKVYGDSMKDAGIPNGSTAVADASAKPRDGDVVFVKIKGKVFIKRLKLHREKVLFISENEKYPIAEFEDDSDFLILGVVKKIVRDI